MNPATVGILTFLGSTIINAICGAVYLAWKKGKDEEVARRHTEDIQELYKAISTNNDLQNNRHIDFYRQFTNLRIKLARKLDINGVD